MSSCSSLVTVLSAQVGGPIGVDVVALAIDPSTPATLYAGTDGGVFKSANGGDSWSASNTGIWSTYVHALAIDPSTPATLYAGTGGYSVFKSTNGGTSWSFSNTGIRSTYVYALVIDPSTPATLYAGTNAGVFKSTNGGTSWTAVNSGSFSRLASMKLSITADFSIPQACWNCCTTAL